jgi:HSP20 family protein
MTLIRWRPMRDMMNIQEEMNRVFDRFFSRDDWGDENLLDSTNWYPHVDICEDKDNFTLSAELPGMKKDEIHITFTDGKLAISGERKQEEEKKDKNYHRVERVYGKFYRAFHIPTKVKGDKISADFNDGILTINLPKVEEVKPKEIEVNVS